MPFLDHFGLIAPFYDRVIPLRQANQIKEWLELPVAGIMLDVGGGTGRVAQVLQHLATQVIVLDASMGMLGQARSKDGLALVCSPGERLPFADGSFERVLMVDALHHVADQRATAGEIWRVLKPGGRVLIVEPDIRRFSAKLVAMFERLLMMRSHFIPLDEIVSLFPADEAFIRHMADGFNLWISLEKRF